MRRIGARTITRFRLMCASRDRGATAVEYAMLAVFISAVITAAVVALGVKTDGLFASLNDKWP